MSKVCIITGRKSRVQKSTVHASGNKTRSGNRAFSVTGPHKNRGKRKTKRQNLNFVTVRTPMGKMLVSMKAYKSYFKTEWKPQEANA